MYQMFPKSIYCKVPYHRAPLRVGPVVCIYVYVCFLPASVTKRIVDEAHICHSIQPAVTCKYQVIALEVTICHFESVIIFHILHIYIYIYMYIYMMLTGWDESSRVYH